MKYKPLPKGKYIAYAKQDTALMAAMDGDSFAWGGCVMIVNEDGWCTFVEDGKEIKRCNNSYAQHNYKIEKL